MAASSGVTLGHGSTVRIGRIPGGGGDPVWTQLTGVEEAQFPDQTPEDVDVTHLGSPAATEETIPGLRRVATLTMPIQYAPGLSTDTLLTELDETSPKEDFLLEITPVGGSVHRWLAYLNIWRPTGIDAKNKMMAEAVFKVKGKVSTDPPAAPENQTLPAISGVAQVGSILTAWPGAWDPSGTFAYQWQVNDGGWVNIAGATGQTYTPIVGQVGNPLRVIVTVTNGTGADSAQSTATANVIAA